MLKCLTPWSCCVGHVQKENCFICWKQKLISSAKKTDFFPHDQNLSYDKIFTENYEKWKKLDRYLFSGFQGGAAAKEDEAFESGDDCDDDDDDFGDDDGYYMDDDDDALKDQATKQPER